MTFEIIKDGIYFDTSESMRLFIGAYFLRLVWSDCHVWVKLSCGWNCHVG